MGLPIDESKLPEKDKNPTVLLLLEIIREQAEIIQQLKDGGRLVLPLGSVTYYQTITLIEKRGDDLIVNYIIKANFVPMVGEALEAGG